MVSTRAHELSVNSSISHAQLTSSGGMGMGTGTAVVVERLVVVE